MNMKWYKNLQESLLINKDILITEDTTRWSNDYKKLINALIEMRYSTPFIHILCGDISSEFGNGTEIYYNPDIETHKKRYRVSGMGQTILKIDREYSLYQKDVLWKVDDKFLYINYFDNENRGARKTTRMRFIMIEDMEDFDSTEIELDYNDLDQLIPDSSFNTGIKCKKFLYELLKLKDGYERAFVNENNIYLLKNVVKPKQLAIKGQGWFIKYSDIIACGTFKSRLFGKKLFGIETHARYSPSLMKYSSISPKQFFK